MTPEQVAAGGRALVTLLVDARREFRNGQQITHEQAAASVALVDPHASDALVYLIRCVVQNAAQFAELGAAAGHDVDEMLMTLTLQQDWGDPLADAREPGTFRNPY